MSQIRPDDLTQPAIDRYLAWDDVYAVVCLTCRAPVLPHRDGGWLHLSADETGHAAVALWTLRTG